MQIDRRPFLKLSGGASGAALVLASAFGGQATTGSTGAPGSMTDDIVPISLDERRARIEKARQLMIENGIEAIYLDSGSNLFYFTVCDGGRLSGCSRLKVLDVKVGDRRSSSGHPDPADCWLTETSMPSN